MKPLRITNGEFFQHEGMSHHLIPHHLSSFKNNSKNFRKIYYNPIRVIIRELSQQAGLPHHLMLCHISPLKNNSGKCIVAN
jgi:hypothetical protein